MSLEPEGGPWSIYQIEGGDELLDAHNDILLKFSVDVETKTKRAIASVPEMIEAIDNLLPYAYDALYYLGERIVAPMLAKEKMDRARALLKRIYAEEDEQ